MSPSRRLLRWAEDTAAAAGKSYLRLDCMTANEALRADYERAGFSYRGEASSDGWRVSRYEKRLDG